ncbi:acyl-CoA dehydrogenase [Mycobacterium branderi]|uniref:Acyl-CoA dehydrogenase n=1 Tax=Mycobacterium branderi TaxID=43348 RepID=A0A7I7WB17_9MYCO|nr:acyl-CoA dehydrogenase [Mycobacterium branderi]MCV7231677.1 acyl-CoA dehydrogenase [Mycobacterium branderi]ORA40347.1 acyl-CoA dehydrogenase [Mycobacterium branderi]BBZ14836.1 acyl-CoA dehydrogenase [Mycobacterium branderi]
MDFGLTDEQQQLADSERSWLGRRDPIARVRAALDVAEVTVDSAAVTHAAESGLIALLTPEMGGTHVDLAVLSEAHGYAASSLPLADLAVAAWLLGQAGAAECDAAAAGSLLVGVARAPLAIGAYDSASLRAATSPLPMAADMAAVAVVGQGQDGEYLALARDPHLVGMKTLDLTRSWARLGLDSSMGQPHRLPAGTLAYLRDAMAVHRSLDALGAAARLLEMTVTYAGQRRQFGAPIGSFQAVKHHCADMAVAVEAARSALWAAALALDGAPDAARSRAASAAAAYAKSAATRVASTALQVHGGIGFTWEHDLHLLLRRIRVDEAFDGSVAEHRAALVTA